MDFQEVRRKDVDLIDLAQYSREKWGGWGSFKNGNIPTGSTKCGEILDRLISFSKNDSAA
jgi:hypothetical protein